jgi:hypothetical protein
MNKLPAEFLGDLGNLLEAGDRHSPAGHPQADGEQIFAAFLDEAASLEIAQVDDSMLTLICHATLPGSSIYFMVLSLQFTIDN